MNFVLEPLFCLPQLVDVGDDDDAGREAKIYELNI